jgi:ApaG protein
MELYTSTTEGIMVSVRPVFLDGQSDIINRKFVFAYFVRIENQREESVKLVRRRWLIRDSRGDVKEVDGEGVIGEQPMIQPDQGYEYSSFCVLATFEGTMEGVYLMRRTNGEEFRVAIPRFTLRAAAN